MKLINLQKVPKEKRKRIMNSYCGGSFTFQEAIHQGGVGVGGLKYFNGLEDLDEIKKQDYLKANTEILKNGLAIYLIDQGGNYLLLLQDTEILTITFSKDIDLIHHKPGFSLFKSCINKGIPYHYAKIMLLEDEIGKLHSPILKIITTSLDELVFHCNRKNPLKISNHFKNRMPADRFFIEYETFKYIEQ